MSRRCHAERSEASRLSPQPPDPSSFWEGLRVTAGIGVRSSLARLAAVPLSTSESSTPVDTGATTGEKANVEGDIFGRTQRSLTPFPSPACGRGAISRLTAGHLLG